MAVEWLRSRGSRDWSLLSPNGKASVVGALSVVGGDNRLALLKELPKGSPILTFMKELVGESAKIYSYLLSDELLKSHWVRPLSRPADQTWHQFLGIALNHALSPEELADASIRRLGRRQGPESSNLTGLLDEFAPWLEDTDFRVGDVARLAVAKLNARRARISQRAAEEAVAGN